ncbi:MAG TPA: SMP-30/gluconolactonase/LRE family protein [Jatrophihabitantaceae bacterium]
MTRVEVAVDGRALVGESPVWDADTRTLLWVDILRGEIHRYCPADGSDTCTRFDTTIGAVVLRRGGGLLTAAGLGVALADPDAGALQWLARAGRGDRMNDAACDPDGRLWAGTLTVEQRPGAAALYRLDGAALTTVLDDVTVSNGLAWSPDGTTLYYADTPTERVDAFDYDPATGAVSGRRTFVDLHDVPGRPDGLTVDRDGGVWVAMARGGAVRHFDPNGRAAGVIEIGPPMVTNCEFGGPDLSDLYVTTGCVGLGEADLIRYPRAGALLRIPDVGVTGLPANRYAA